MLTFLSPDWRLLKEPSLWLEAAQHVVFSLQLGLGAQSALARCNKFRHNLVRDAAVVLVTHTVWVLLSVTGEGSGHPGRAPDARMPPPPAPETRKNESFRASMGAWGSFLDTTTGAMAPGSC